MSSQELINGWWHAASIEDAIESIELDLQAIGIAARVPRDALASAVDHLSAAGLDEADQRRHQIGLVARFANHELAGAHRVERVRAYGAVEDPDDEPRWLVVTLAQHADARLQYGAPGPLPRSGSDAWAATATSRLAGRRVWASQWHSLAKLHRELGMPEDALITSVRKPPPDP